jgi:BirA family biotin operon repressor/biotin-[acetyl-CoA-carboxylase] ligase
VTGGGDLAARIIAPVIRLESVDSTQAVLFALAADGAADGTVVVANFQRAGRGRRGRTWTADSGEALLASFLMRPRLASRELPLLSYVVAVAAADAVAAFGAAPRLKWPNDVLVDGRKIAGILLESRITSRDDADDVVVVVGVGLNVGQRAFPAELSDRATSLRLATGREVTIDAALAALRSAIDGWRERFAADGFAPVRSRWLALADTIGRRVHVDGVEGVAVDLAANGGLVLQDGDVRHTVFAGEVAAPRR